MNSAIASADNATLASVASNYALRTVTDQLALDLAAKQSGLDVDTKIANALLDRPSTTDLTAAVNLKTTPADVDQKVATALLPYTDTTGVNSLLAVRDAQITAADSAGPFASSSDLTAAETSLQSAINAILAQLAALTTGGGTNLINAQAWPGEITWDWLV
ncbi:unnamed protein product, partial [Symbiodinium pilosum]